MNDIFTFLYSWIQWPDKGLDYLAQMWDSGIELDLA